MGALAALAFEDMRLLPPFFSSVSFMFSLPERAHFVARLKPSLITFPRLHLSSFEHNDVMSVLECKPAMRYQQTGVIPLREKTFPELLLCLDIERA